MHIFWGWSPIKPGDRQTALDWIRRALKLRPDVGGYYLNFGNVLSSLGQIDDAIAAFEKAVELRPDMGAGPQ